MKLNLVPCPACNNMNSPTALTCPKCGHKLSGPLLSNRSEQTSTGIVGAVIIGLILAFLLFLVAAKSCGPGSI